MFQISPHQFRLREYVPSHGVLHLRLGRGPHVRQRGIEGIEFEEVAVSANRRAGSAVVGALEIRDTGYRLRG